jgi:protein TonB
MNFKYPAKARDNGVGGSFEFCVVINESVQMTDYQLIKGIGSGYDEAAVYAIKQMQKIGFEPAIAKDMPLKVQYILRGCKKFCVNERKKNYA